MSASHYYFSEICAGGLFWGFLTRRTDLKAAGLAERILPSTHFLIL